MSVKMRISSGKARGISLTSPKGDATRPATDSARQAIFSSLGELCVDSKILDLFAGTGAYGLEALSRGASSAIFVEKDRNALDCIRKNLAAFEKCAGKTHAKIIAKDCFSLKAADLPFSPDLIFADPPYPILSQKGKDIIELFKNLGSKGAICILEVPGEFTPPEVEGIELVKRLGKASKGKPSQIIFRV